MRPLIDSRMMARDEQFFTSRCTIQQIAYTPSDSNQQVPTGQTDIPGLIGIPCRLGPLIEVRPTDDESRESMIEGQFERRQLKLNGFFPQIVNRTMQAVVDGVSWQIRGNESDSAQLTTRLKVERVMPQ